MEKSQDSWYLGNVKEKIGNKNGFVFWNKFWALESWQAVILENGSNKSQPCGNRRLNAVSSDNVAEGCCHAVFFIFGKGSRKESWDVSSGLGVVTDLIFTSWMHLKTVFQASISLVCVYIDMWPTATPWPSVDGFTLLSCWLEVGWGSAPLGTSPWIFIWESKLKTYPTKNSLLFLNNRLFCVAEIVKSMDNPDNEEVGKTMGIKSFAGRMINGGLMSCNTNDTHFNVKSSSAEV